MAVSTEAGEAVCVVHGGILGTDLAVLQRLEPARQLVVEAVELLCRVLGPRLGLGLGLGLG